jgi:UDP:flavonoid glycosyltransferase YjiC (YdhE family)
VRILFSCVAGSDQHLFCLIPLARAALAAGDEVVVASGPDRGAQVTSHGFTFRPAGPQFAALVHDARDRFPDFSIGGEQEEIETFTRFFARVAAPAAIGDLIAVVDEFRPDLVVHEPADLAGPLAAAACGVRYATHDWGLAVPDSYGPAIAAAVAPMWHAWRLDPPASGGLYRQLHIRICPPSLDPSAGRAAQLLRPSAAAGPDPEAWTGSGSERPLVHVSLGSAGFNQAFHLLGFVVDAVSREDVQLVVTVGRGNDPRALGPLGDNVRAEPFVPHAALMPHCDAVVTHGGSGTVLAALEHGVPLLVLPLGADQYRTADAVTAGGAGTSLRGRITAAEVRASVRRLLDDPPYREAAQRVAREIEAMPSAAEALAAIRARG